MLPAYTGCLVPIGTMHDIGSARQQKERRQGCGGGERAEWQQQRPTSAARHDGRTQRRGAWRRRAGASPLAGTSGAACPGANGIH